MPQTRSFWSEKKDLFNYSAIYSLHFRDIRVNLLTHRDRLKFKLYACLCSNLTQHKKNIHKLGVWIHKSQIRVKFTPNKISRNKNCQLN